MASISRSSSLPLSSALLALFFLAALGHSSFLFAEPLTLVWFRGSAGALDPPPCMPDGRADRPGWVDKARALATLPPSPSRVVIDHGPTLGADPYLNDLLADPADGHAELRRLLATFSPDLALPGQQDFVPGGETERTALDRMLAQVPWKARALNVACADHALCPHLSAEPFVWTGPAGRVAFLPVVLEEVAGRVRPEALAGITFGPVDASLVRRTTARLKAQGVERFVLVARVGEGADQLARVNEILEAVPEIGLALVDGGGRATLTSRDERGRTRLINLEGARTGALLVRLALLDGLEVLEVAPLKVVPDAPPRGGLPVRFCERWQVPLTSTVPDPSFWEPERFVAWLLEVLRHETGAEVAVLHRRALRAGFLKRYDGAGLTRGLFHGALPFADEAVRVRVDGKALAALLDRLAPSTTDRLGTRLAGVERRDGRTYVNGRKLDETRPYRVVLPDYLLEGGDGLVPASFAQAASARVAFGPIRDVIIGFLEAGRDREVGDGRIRPESFPDPAFRPLWTLAATAGLYAQHVATWNRAAYEESQLTRSDLLQVSGNVEARADLTTVQHALRNLASVRYGKSGAGWSHLSEVEDLAVLEDTYEGLWFPRLFSDAPSWALPSPYVRSRLEGETDVAAAAPYRHLQWTGSGGVNWQLTGALAVYVGYAASREVLDPAGRFAHGVGFGYALTPWELRREGAHKVQLTSRFDATWAGFGATPFFRGLGSTSLDVTLLGPLSLSLRYDLFLYQRGDAAVGYNHGASVGLKVEALEVIQQL